MKKNRKINVFLLETLFLLFVSSGCEREEYEGVQVELEKPRVEYMYCQDAPDGNPHTKIEYEYQKGNLITKTSFNHEGKKESETSFTYDAENRLMTEVYRTPLDKIEKVYVYNELGQLVKIKKKVTRYNAQGNAQEEYEREEVRVYENDRLVKVIKEWGGFSTYAYEKGNRIIKVDYTKMGDKHHITTLRYSNGLLMEEKKETHQGKLLYVKNYTYDNLGRLLWVREGEHTIEECKYENNRLIEKRTYYFGIDPGFYMCHGNFIYRYQY